MTLGIEGLGEQRQEVIAWQRTGEVRAMVYENRFQGRTAIVGGASGIGLSGGPASPGKARRWPSGI